jgi:Abnormal spindle-like microcephaly-assoc'd, ASPM-SPD-2-Hydin/FG-GAP-like repeat
MCLAAIHFHGEQLVLLFFGILGLLLLGLIWFTIWLVRRVKRRRGNTAYWLAPIPLVIVLGAMFIVDRAQSPNYGPPEILSTSKLGRLIKALPDYAPFGYSGLAFYKGKLYVATNLGLLELDEGRISRVFRFQKNDSVISGPWLDTADQLLWALDNHTNQLLNYDGVVWHRVDFPRPQKGYYSRGDVLEGPKPIGNANGFWLQSGGSVWRWDPIKNGDGTQDIYVWLYDNTFGPGAPGGRDLFQFLGNGDGTFQPTRKVLQNLSAMTMMDLNHDGRLDVIDIESASTLIAEGEPGTATPQVNVYLGQADGSFGSPTTYMPYSGTFETFTGNNVTRTGGFATYFGDFNGDGNADVAVFQSDSLSGGPSYLQFLMGNADGTFTPTYDVFDMGIQEIPDLTVPNLLGDGRAAFLQAPNFTASYQVLAAANAPAFQIQPAETPVLGGSDSLAVALDLPSASDTVVSLSASDPGVQITPSVTIPAGQLSVEVPFTLGSGVTQNRWFSLTAKAGGETQIAYDFPGRAIDSFTQVVVPPPVNTVQPDGISELWSAGVQSNGDASGTFQTSCQGLPAGMTCQFQFGLVTFTVPGGGFQNLVFQISVSSTTSGGTYNFNIVSTDGETTLTASETIQVVAPPPPMPAVSFNPMTASFPPALVGSTQTQNVILTNTGAATLNVAGITIPSGANAFTQSNTCGSSLAANTTCTITITLNTKSTGSLTGSLAVADNASGSPQTVPLSASVGDLAIQPATGAATTMTVPAGTPAIFSLQVTPNNYTGVIAMGCSGAISMGTCTVQPTSIPLDGGITPVGFQVRVTSTARSGAGFIPSQYPRHKVPLVLGLALLLLLAAAVKSNFGGSARGQLTARCGQLAALLLTGALMLASCGGGSGTGTGPGSGGGNSGTPPGSYVFTVTASSSGGSRSLPVTLIVQ